MKYIKYFRFLFITCLSLTFSLSLTAQQNKKSDTKKIAVKNMIDSQSFIFEAQSFTTMRGNFRNLTSPYDVTITKDTLQSYLPYFGRAFTPEYNATRSALDFTSTQFSYSVSPHKKNGWDIIIKPKDKTDIQQYFFTVFNNGSASLTVNSNSRDPISFNGSVRKRY